MRLAKEIMNYKMTSTTEFNHHLTTLIAQENITRVVETGSYLGNGTTKAVLKGFRINELEYEFVSIEVNPEYFEQAKQNNIGTQIKFINGLSIPRSMLPNSISYDIPENVIVDHLDPNNYTKETAHNVPDSALSVVVEMLPELVILDSAGHLGLIEFNYLMQLLHSHTFYLALDDTNHLKHYHTLELVKQHPNKFEVLWNDQSGDHQSAIILVHGS